MKIDGHRKEFGMVETAGGHYSIVLETKGKDSLEVLYLEDEEEKSVSYKAVKKVHEINNHNRKEQIIATYRNAGWLNPDLVNTINRVDNDC